MTLLTHNVDETRARVMALEDAAEFDEQAWAAALADLRAAGRACALADAERRMETARANAAFLGSETKFQNITKIRLNGAKNG